MRVRHQRKGGWAFEAGQPWRDEPHKPSGRSQKKQYTDGHSAWRHGDDGAADLAGPAAHPRAVGHGQDGKASQKRERRCRQCDRKGQHDGARKARCGKRLAHRFK